ncbi:hypothetical protein B0T16DRAFT_414979 [Cercophora newfieldiana]|uniref:Uncharacterized protein n=1 Tax=Cercophora newfieldiana TaxID=92897 RepID=A0AA39Y018_9PEZI|nr:hypothetical protein B0T16DRAFT_414979 [Cercophora newfieldiana]
MLGDLVFFSCPYSVSQPQKQPHAGSGPIRPLNAMFLSAKMFGVLGTSPSVACETSNNFQVVAQSSKTIG